MKKTVLLFIAFTATVLLKANVITDTVTTGAQYANQVWYSLPNGTVGSAPKDNWDIAFQITGSGYSASILANTQKGLMVYQSPYSVDDWANVDTAGIKTWNVLHNSDTSWNEGALNSSPDGNFDLGWGIYDFYDTHYVIGDSVFVIKLASGGGWKKLRIDGLISGKYSFTWADLNGNNEQSGSIKKSDYTGKRFSYFSLVNNTALDREPAATSWDLTFTKYITTLYAQGEPIPYSVTGLLQNINATAIKAYPVNDLAANDYDNYLFQTPINIIGHDWKTYDLDNGIYYIEDSTVYFVKRSNGDIWKITFLEFGGSATGEYIFNKELIYKTAVGIEETGNTLSALSLYPNPAQNRINFIYNLNGSDEQNTALQIRDASGRIVMEQNILVQPGLQQTGIDISALQTGIYLVSLPAFGSKAVRFVVQ